MHLIFECISEKFHQKILFDSGVISVQVPTTKYLGFQYICLLQTLVRKWRCVVKTRSTFSRSVAVSSLGHTDLFFIDESIKVNGQYYRDQHQLHQQLATCLETSLLFNNAPPQGVWDRAAVNLRNTRLHRSSSVASQQSWPEPGRLPDLGKLQEHVYRNRIHDVDHPKSRLIEEREYFHQVFIDEAIRQWRLRPGACIRAHRGHFEHRL